MLVAVVHVRIVFVGMGHGDMAVQMAVARARRNWGFMRVLVMRIASPVIVFVHMGQRRVAVQVRVFL